MSLRGALVAVLLGTFTLGLAVASVAIVLPIAVARAWRRRLVAVPK